MVGILQGRRGFATMALTPPIDSTAASYHTPLASFSQTTHLMSATKGKHLPNPRQSAHTITHHADSSHQLPINRELELCKPSQNQDNGVVYSTHERRKKAAQQHVNVLEENRDGKAEDRIVVVREWLWLERVEGVECDGCEVEISNVFSIKF